MQLNINVQLTKKKSKENNWLPNFPNPADFRFDYYKLLNNASHDVDHGLAKIKSPKKVAIIGAGSAGMTVARELLRCGFHVDLYEATDRIGGRLYTAVNPEGKEQTGIELGAMRMPFFSEPGDKNCILEYYMLHEAGLKHRAKFSLFPNPGSAEGNTGIYVKKGLGPTRSFDKPQLIDWPFGEDPDNAELRNLAAKTARFIDFFIDYIKEIYTEDSDRWPQLWSKIVAHYSSMTFNDLIMASGMNVYAIDNGDFGGFGMNQEEAELLYTIGTGDGSWGSFYSIGALWFIRCTMFGFGGDKLQTVLGMSNPESMPYYDQANQDSLGNDMAGPLYQGVQSLVEYLYYCKTGDMKFSLHESERARLFTRTPVTKIMKQKDKSITIESIEKAQHDRDDEQIKTENYDFVFVTSGQWASQMSFRFEGFSKEELPQEKITAEHTQHNISSCKLFFPLTEQYWKKEGNKIPQILVTDTFIQDAYALAWREDGVDKGAILASYTWEDDSLKLLPFDEKQLVEKVTDRLRRITMETLGQDITEYFIKDKPVMIQWIKQPTYDGCAKLYRQRDEKANFIDLSYNQNYSHKSNLYFTGENYSVEGGWTEPALRSALDGVMRLLNNVDAKFGIEDFDYQKDYPKWKL